jgi:(1->4)-alpha-D-glucan 1-alpha-D-glucosylmutase
MSAPSGTYRIQLTPDFGFDAAAATVPYLADLGVSHVYLSPILEAVPGSQHGYDVVDHTALRSEFGGMEAFDRLVAACHDRGLGLVVDVVPNHMAIPTPEWINKPLWSVLRDGPSSAFARWFDVDWAAQHRNIIMPVLGDPIGDCIDRGEIVVDESGDEPVVRYFDHVFPIRPGTETLQLEPLLDAQWYRLAYWRVADDELNYRRFFDVGTLVAVRMEIDEVFDATHALLLQLVADGKIDGLRIDHPDGMADPRGYVRRLAERAPGTWVVVEKILEGDETLPADWPCAGTTGYDALAQVGRLFVDASGSEPLRALYTELTDEPGAFDEVARSAKRLILAQSLRAELGRLADLLDRISYDDIRLRDHTRHAFEQCLTELLVGYDAYRGYVVPGEPAPEQAIELAESASELARECLPHDRHATLDAVVDLILGRRGRSAEKDEFLVRFQQTCGPTMAKGVEDTAFYRWFRLAALNEVGGDPERFGGAPETFHEYAARLAASWPTAMTTLSTHDTKRAEDVRARLSVLSELPDEWADDVRSWRATVAAVRPPLVDANTEYLLWQTLVGAWPIDADRLLTYLEKAVREAKVSTTWTAPNEAYEAAVRELVSAVLDDDAVMSEVGSFVERIAPYARVVTLGQKLVQLTMPGVPDVYQGCELPSFALVDPDNRRPADGAALAAALGELDHTADEARPVAGLAAEKLLVTSRALRLRRHSPEWFGADASYDPVPSSTPHAVGFVRADQVVCLVTRLARALERAGGFGAETVTLPPGEWTDVLAGRKVVGGEPTRLADVLGPSPEVLPVALFVRVLDRVRPSPGPLARRFAHS